MYLYTYDLPFLLYPGCVCGITHDNKQTILVPYTYNAKPEVFRRVCYYVYTVPHL